MKNINSYLNIIGISLIIILMGINEYVLGKSSINRLLLSIIVLILGIGIIIINIKSIVRK